MLKRTSKISEKTKKNSKKAFFYSFKLLIVLGHNPLNRINSLTLEGLRIFINQSIIHTILILFNHYLR